MKPSNYRTKALILVFSFMVVVLVLFVVAGFRNLRDCEEQVHHKQPVIEWWTSGKKFFPSRRIRPNSCGKITCAKMREGESYKCEGRYAAKAYLFDGYHLDLGNLPQHRKNSDIWALYYDETPKKFIKGFNEDVLKLFNYSSTYSKYSDVPFPLQYLKNYEDITSLDYYIDTKDKNKLLDDIAPVLYLNSNCDTATERDVYVEELMKYISIDSYGKCLNNREMPHYFLGKRTGTRYDYYQFFEDPTFLRFLAQYKFTIAIENGVCNDYVTEKFWRPIHVGSVPIYFGSPRIRDWMPNNKSAILLTDYPTPVIMANYLKLLLANDTLYEKHLEHKTKGMVSNPAIFEELKRRPSYVKLNVSYYHELFKAELFCFVCKKVHEVMNGKKVSRIIDKSHLDCPMPISALGLRVNPDNFWVKQVYLAKKQIFYLNRLLRHLVIYIYTGIF